MRILIGKAQKQCLYVIGKSNIMLPWTNIIVLQGKNNFNIFTSHFYRNNYQQGSKLFQTETFENWELHREDVRIYDFD